ncbi:MAG: hypothetical protein ACFFBP_11865 [Promethearchaeota archaeon]
MEWIKEIRPNQYKILKTLNLTKDVTEIVCKKIATLELKIKDTEKKVKTESTQINLDKFFRQYG